MEVIRVLTHKKFSNPMKLKDALEAMADEVFQIYVDLFGAGELLDRISIIKVAKDKRNTSEAMKPSVEHLLLLVEKPANIKEFITKISIDGINSLKVRKAINDLFNRLYKINYKIWELESQIRKIGSQPSKLDKIGELALIIRDLNWQRQKIKNKINNLTNTGLQFSKLDYWHKKDE